MSKNDYTRKVCINQQNFYEIAEEEILAMNCDIHTWREDFDEKWNGTPDTVINFTELKERLFPKIEKNDNHLYIDYHSIETETILFQIEGLELAIKFAYLLSEWTQIAQVSVYGNIELLHPDYITLCDKDMNPVISVCDENEDYGINMFIHKDWLDKDENNTDIISWIDSMNKNIYESHLIALESANYRLTKMTKKEELDRHDKFHLIEIQKIISNTVYSLKLLKEENIKEKDNNMSNIRIDNILQQLSDKFIDDLKEHITIENIPEITLSAIEIVMQDLFKSFIKSHQLELKEVINYKLDI